MKENKCKMCLKSFNAKKLMDSHIQSVHLNDQEKCDKVACNYCDKSFVTKAYLKQHVKLVHMNDKVKCDICSKLFSTLQYLKIHTKACNGSARVKCSNCEKSFSSESHMRRHVKIIHMNDRIKKTLEKIECDFCNRFYPSDYLAKHKDMVHFKVRNHKCDICNIEFSAKSDWKRHLNTKNHLKVQKDGLIDPCRTQINKGYKVAKALDENEFVECEMCHKLYSRQYMYQHKTYVHARSRNFKCNTCDKTFIQRSDLNRHVKNVHKTDPAENKVQEQGIKHIEITDGDINSHEQEYVDSTEKESPLKNKWLQCMVCNEILKTHSEFFEHVENSHKIV